MRLVFLIAFYFARKRFLSQMEKPHTDVSSIGFVNQQPETCNDFYCEIKKEGVHPHERIVQHIVC